MNRPANLRSIRVVAAVRSPLSAEVLEHTPTILCVASFFKGNEFIRACRRHGGRVVLLTREKQLGAAWARESLADLIALPAEADTETYLAAANAVAACSSVAHVVALEEYDVELAAHIREHLC